MSKWLKWAAVIVAALVLCTVGLVVFLRFYFSKERITAWVKPPLEDYLHRKISLTDASLSLRGLRLDGLEIRKEGEKAPLLKGEHLELRWNPKALLSGKMVIQTLAFDQPEITLIRQKDGSLNIADFLPQKEVAEKAPAPQARVERKPTGIPLLVSLLAMQNGRLTLVDRSRQPEVTFQLSDIQSRVSNLAAVGPISFQLEGHVEGKNKGTVAVEGTADLAAKDIASKLDLQGIEVPPLLSFFGKDKSIPIQQGSMTLEASLAIQGLDRCNGQGRLQFTDLEMQTAEGVTQLISLLAGFDLRAVRSEHQLNIADLNLELNGQKAQIQGKLTQWDKRPQLQFTLTSPQIRMHELASLLSPGSPQSDSAGPKAKTGKSDAKPVPLDAQGDIHLDWLFYNKLVASNVDCKLKLESGKLEVKPLTASLYAGTLQGDFEAKLDRPGPPFQLGLVSKDILLDEVARHFSPETADLWAGSMSMNTRARGKGGDLRVLQSSTAFRIDEARFSGHPLVVKFAEFFQAEELKQIEFARVNGKVSTGRGVATLEDFLLEGAIARMDAGGTTGLIDKKLDLLMSLRIRTQYVGRIPKVRQIVPFIADKEGFVQLPLKVGGTLANPEYRLDENWLAQKLEEAAARQPVKKVADDVLQMPALPQLRSITEQKQKQLQSEEIQQKKQQIQLQQEKQQQSEQQQQKTQSDEQPQQSQ
jgi:uncharacterized protein involved in outer membrane biogenesis